MGFFDRFRRGSTPPPDDLAIAEQAWARDDDTHAAEHVARALQADPSSAGAHALVEQMAARRDCVERYAPLAEGGQYLGTILLRAALLGATGQHAAAVSLCVQALAAVPELPLADWVERWARQPGFADRDGMLAAIFPAMEPNAIVAMKAAVVPIVAAVRTRFATDEKLMFLHARLARDAGLLEQSLAVAAGFHRAHPCHVAAVVAYGTLKRLGRMQDALALIDDAIALAPDAAGRRSALTDRGDTLLDLGRGAEAREAYKSALAIEPGHPWCAASVEYLAACEGDAAARAELAGRATRGEPRAVELIARLSDDVLAAPGSAIVNLITQVLAQDVQPPPQTGSIKMMVSAPEPPTALLAARAELRRRGWRVETPLAVQTIPDPDPRRPVRDVECVLWKFDGNEPRPGLDAPPPAIARAIGEIARTPFDPVRWLAEGPAASWRELAAVMVHPPPPPDGMMWWDWWYRVDVAAALAIARLPNACDALTTLVHGPDDWSGRAAAIALELLDAPSQG